jgi:hypothetical protein
MRSIRIVAAVLAAFTLLLAACGDSDSDGGGGGGASAFGGGSWCDWARQIDEAEPFGEESAVPDPAEMAAAFAEFEDIMDQAVDAAPDEIEDDVRLVAGAAKGFIEVLSDADFDLFQIDPSDERVALIDSDEVNAANERIEEYNREVCGIETEGSSSDSDEVLRDGSPVSGNDDDGGSLSDLPGEGTIEERVIQELIANGMTEEEAQCLTDALGSAFTADVDGTEDVFAVFEECGIDMARLAQLGN